MKRILKLNLLLLLLFLVLNILNVKALVSPTAEFYCNDYANILNNETKDYIINHSKSLEAKTKAQIVVVTVKNLEGRTIEEYATSLFRKFGIGDARENNGLLLLLALEERQFRVEVGSGLEGILPDGLTGRYQDQYIIPYLKNNEWDIGIKNGYAAFYKKICEYYNIDANDILVTTPPSKNRTKSIMPYIFVIIIGFLVGQLIKNLLLFNEFKSAPKIHKPQKNNSILYLLVGIFLYLICEFLPFTEKIYSLSSNYQMYLRCFLVGLIFGFITDGYTHISRHSNSSRYSSRTHSSRSSFGGGGSSRGGGSTRHF